MTMDGNGDTMTGDDAVVGPTLPTSALSVLGVGMLLLGLVGGILFLAVPRGGELSATDVLGDLFDVVASPLPFDLTTDDARRLPTGERVVTFGAGADDSGEGPVALTIVEYPASRAEKVLADQFRELRFETGEGMGHGGGRGRGGGDHGKGKGDDKPKPKLQEKAFLVWHGFDATFARLRHPHTPPKTDEPKTDEPKSDEPKRDAVQATDRPPGRAPEIFHEVVRVNLSTGGRCIIAYVRFADGAAGDKDTAAEIVAAFTPRS